MAGLRTNRDFVLLQAGQFFSGAGSQSTAVAYPLLVLALTNSPAKAGLVAFARALPFPIFGLPAGVAADHLGRKRMMIVADVVRAIAVCTLAVLVITDEIAFWMIPIVAFVEGAGSALFGASEAAALRSVVPADELPAAVATVTGRRAAVQVTGPSVGGALFGIAQGLPFAVDAASYALSTASLVAMRTPFEEEREPDDQPIGRRLTEGLRFLWGHPFLRVSTIIFGLLNLFAPGLFFCVVVIAKRHGYSSAAAGGLIAVLGGSVVVGSLLSGFVRRKLPPRAVVLLEVWCWTACGLFLVWPTPIVLVGSVMLPAMAFASTDSIVHTARLTLTPDRLVGRTVAAATTLGLAISPLGPLAAGILIDRSERMAVGIFAATALVLAVIATRSRSLAVPPLPDAVATAG